jgi:hypothetical protein
MTDTTPEIQQKQLAIWLSKTPMDRLRQTLEDNEGLFNLWAVLKKSNLENNQTILTVKQNNYLNSK